jgi:hypothetical protein
MENPQPNLLALAAYLDQLLAARLDAKAAGWLAGQLAKLQVFAKKDFFLAFSVAPRLVGREALAPTQAELAQADRLRPGFQPGQWSLAQTVRTRLLLAMPTTSEAEYLALLDQLFTTAEVNELVALYAALPLLAFPAAHASRAAEGVRTNMAVVFAAVALNNPYPAEHLDENAWNQLFLKAVFTGQPLAQVQGIKARANATLAKICSDYAHERWAAHREVTPELWLPVAQFLDERLLADIERLLASPEPAQRAAAIAACTESPLPAAKELLARAGHLA